jgi:hypothetical protein
MAAGITLIVLRSSGSHRDFALLAAGLALVACSFLQWRAAWALWHRSDSMTAWLRSFDRVFARRAFCGALSAYLVSLAIGPAPYLGWALLAAVAGWLSVLTLPFSASPDQRERWLAWSRHRAVRRAEFVLLALLLAPAVAELTLQTVKLARTSGWVAAAAATPAESLVPLAHDSLARHGVSPLPPGPLRIAILDAEPNGRDERAYQAHVERTLPGVKLLPVASRLPWSSASPDELAEQLAEEHVDLVLAMLPVCGELTREKQSASWFDWRQFELARVAGYQASVNEPLPPAKSHDYESFCGSLSPQLAACRTPIDERMRRRWQETFECVDALSKACHARELPLAVVLVPGEFQVNSALRDTLARRAGYATEQIDVELPQRKLAGYAAERKLPLVDLLPTLRICRESPFERHADQLSEAGHRATASAISGWLESRYGSQLAATSRLTSAP